MRVVLQLRHCGSYTIDDRVTQALKELHWLPIAQRIAYKLSLHVHKSLIGHEPVYISKLLTSVADVQSRSAFRYTIQ